MPRVNAANNARTTLAQDINASATSFAVADGATFPAAPFLITIDDEIMEVGAKSANTFSAVLRGREGTAPLAHSNGAIVENRFTAGAYGELETSAGAQTKANTAEQNAKSYVDGKVKTDVPTGAKFTDTVTTVNNTLASTSTTEALSAAQGKKLNDALTSHLSDYTLQIPYVTATGSANIYSVLLNGVTSYYEGMAVAMKINVDNTGASTININGLGAKPIKKPNGNDISAGNLKAGSIYSMRYNGVNFILQGSDTAGDAIPEDVLSGKTFSNDEGEQTGTLALTGDAVISNVLSSKTFYSTNPKTHLTGSMPNHEAVVITPGTSNQTIAAGYHNGSGYVKGDANLIAGNIAIEKSIFGVNGNLIPIPDDILYYLGYEQISFVLSYQSGGQYSFTKESNYLYLYQGNNFGEANITTNSAIDFSNIFGVIVLWENKGSTSAGSSGLYLSTSKTGRYDNYIGKIGKSFNFTLTGDYLDTTSYNSSYYVKFYSRTTESNKYSYLKIYKIILLKNFS